MSVVAQACKVIGYILLFAGVALIAVGIISTWYFNGFAAVQELMSQFNFVNYLAIAVTLAPGFLLISVSERLEKRSLRKEK